MIGMLNGKERTIIEVRELMNQAGWKLAHIHQSSASAFSTASGLFDKWEMNTLNDLSPDAL